MELEVERKATLQKGKVRPGYKGKVHSSLFVRVCIWSQTLILRTDLPIRMTFLPRPTSNFSTLCQRRLHFLARCMLSSFIMRISGLGFTFRV